MIFQKTKTGKDYFNIDHQCADMPDKIFITFFNVVKEYALVDDINFKITRGLNYCPYCGKKLK